MLFCYRSGSEIKMVHVSTPALCLVLLSHLSAGFPTTSPLQDTSGPTKIELLAAEQGESASAKADTATTAKLKNADTANNVTAGYSSPTASTVNVLTGG
jgi:hypothetical protein